MTRPAVLIFGGFSRRSGHGGASLASCAVWLSLLLAGCATSGPGGNSLASMFASKDRQEVVVSEAQACAIGYDLARAIHDTVSLRRTVIVAPTRSSPCERHALTYLRLAGFRIDETRQDEGSAGGNLDIELAPLDGDTVSAVATLGGDLRIARSYRPVRTGVIAQGPISIQHLNPDTYTRRTGEGAS